MLFQELGSAWWIKKYNYSLAFRQRLACWLWNSWFCENPTQKLPGFSCRTCIENPSLLVGNQLCGGKIDSFHFREGLRWPWERRSKLHSLTALFFGHTVWYSIPKHDEEECEWYHGRSEHEDPVQDPKDDVFPQERPHLGVFLVIVRTVVVVVALWIMVIILAWACGET